MNYRRKSSCLYFLFCLCSVSKTRFSFRCSGISFEPWCETWISPANLTTVSLQARQNAFDQCPMMLENSWTPFGRSTAHSDFTTLRFLFTRLDFRHRSTPRCKTHDLRSGWRWALSSLWLTNRMHQSRLKCVPIWNLLDIKKNNCGPLFLSFAFSGTPFPICLSLFCHPGLHYHSKFSRIWQPSLPWEEHAGRNSDGDAI